MPYPDRKGCVDATSTGRGRKLRFWIFALFCLIVLATAFLVLAYRHGTPVLLLMQSSLRQKRVNPIDGLTYVWISAGSFQMGCSPEETECDGDETPAKQVTIAKGFRLGESEVTQAAYEKVTGKNPSHFSGTVNAASRPVEQVTWYEARAYCQAIGGRLPADAEWEYSARAGRAGARYGNVYSVAWLDSNARSATHPVKQKDPNTWGLYDTLGNVAEWVDDTYPGTAGQARIARGGAWSEGVEMMGWSSRGASGPWDHSDIVGFRCAWK